MERPQRFAEKNSLVDAKIHLAQILSSLPVGICLVDTSQKVVYANPTAELMFDKQFSFSESVAFGDFISCENSIKDPSGCGFSQACGTCPLFTAFRLILDENNRDKVSGETEVNREASPNRMWLKYHGQGIEFNRQRFALLTLNDITEQRDVTSKLQEEEKKHRSILQTAMDGFCVVDSSGQLMEVNAAYSHLSGYTENELLTMTISDLECVEDLEQTAAHIQKIISEREDRFESRLRRKDGSCFDVEISAQYRPSNGGQLFAFLRDITERKKTETKLLKLLARYKGVLAALKDAIFLVDPFTQSIIECNEAASHIFGYPRDQLIGYQADLLHVDKKHHEQFVQRAHAAYEDPGYFKTEFLMLTNNGTVFPTEHVAIPIRGEGGKIDYVVSVVSDISERKRSEKALQESENRLKLALNAAKAGTWEWDLETDGNFWSEVTYRLYGLDPKSTPPGYDSWLQSILAEDRDKIRSAVKASVETGTPIDIEWRVNTLDESTRWLMSRGEPLFDSEHRPIKYAGIVLDITDRKMADAAKSAMQQRMEAMLVGIADSFFSVDTQWRFTMVNPAAENAPFGRPAAELIGNVIWEVYPELVGTAIFQHYRRAAKTHALEHYEAKSPLNGLWYEFFMLGWRGGVNVYMRDFTQRKRYESELTWNADRNRLLSDTAKSFLGCGTLHDLVQESCRRVMAFLDCQAFFNFIVDGPTDRMRLNVCGGILEAEAINIQNIELGCDGFCRAASGRKAIIKENILSDDDPRTQWLKTCGIQACCCHPLIVQDRLVGTLFFGTTSRPHFENKEIEVMREVSNLLAIAMAHVMDEQTLRENEEKFRNFTEQAFVGAFIIQDETFQYVNPKFAEIFGYTPEECLDQMRFQRLVHPEDQVKVQEQVRRRIHGEIKSVQHSFRGIKKTGEIINVEVYGASLIYKGKPAAIGTLMDITKGLQMEKLLAQSQRMEAIGSLAGGIAHDFNNILFPIIGLSELFLEDLAPQSLQYENVNEILKAGKRGRELVKQILAFSRQSEREIVPARMQSILKDALKLCRASIPSNIEIKQDIESTCGLVRADASQIHQVAMNLITNAYHAVEPNSGKIFVSLKETVLDPQDLTDTADRSLHLGRYALLTVSDTGCGIDPAIMNKIFEPYFTTKPKGKGTGLGLAMVYGIVKEHGGEVRVHSKIGEGSTFQVYLPLMGKVDETVLVQESFHEGGHERVLLVDDEEAVVALERKILERLGYRVTSRTSSLDALEVFRAKQEDFDLVISDMTMPDMTGDQLVRELKAIRADIPVIICTGFSERISHEKAEVMGISAFLMKPVLKSEMAELIRDELDEVIR